MHTQTFLSLFFCRFPRMFKGVLPRFWRRAHLTRAEMLSTWNPEGPARHLDASRQKFTPHCLAAILDSQLPSPKLSLKMPPKLPLTQNRGHFCLFQNCPRGEGNCAAAGRQKLSRGNFLEARKPTQNPEIPKKHRVHTNFFEKFARTFAFFPVTRVRNPTEIVQKNLFR